MEEFIGMNRNKSTVKIPQGMWEFAKNITLDKKIDSISDEYGLDALGIIPGNLLGKIITNEEIVIFSLDGDFSCIGVFKKDDLTTYIPYIRSIYLTFKINRPIEGVFFYNYKKELIICFSDGVFRDSNTPKIINLYNIEITLDINYEFLNPSDIGQLNMFPTTLEGLLDITYDSTISIPIDVVYISFSYILSDGISSTAYFPASYLAYSLDNWKEEENRKIVLNFTELDNNYSNIKIGLLVNVGGVLTGYESTQIGYLNQTLTYTIDSLGAFSEISTDELIVPTIFYNRIKSMTIQSNRLVIGNIATSDEIDTEVNNLFQKYVNMLEVGLTYVTDRDDLHNHPTLCPDEVYAIYIQPQLLSGEYLKAYPLIGREAVGNELDILDETTLIALGLRHATNGEGIEADTYKRFHIENNGEFVLPPPYNELDSAHNELTFGYWENEENYPNIEEFNSTEDYEGNPLTGEDLRNTPIRYFRVPGLDNIVKKIPSILGHNHINKENIIYNDSKTKFYGRVPKFGIYIKNFDSIVPSNIKDKLQGFKLLIVKKTLGDVIVEDISFAKNIFPINYSDSLSYKLPVFGIPFADSGDDNYNPNITDLMTRLHGESCIYSNTLLTYKSFLSSRIIKANYAGEFIGFPTSKTDINTTGSLGKENLYLVPNTQRYAYITDIEYVPEDNIVANSRWAEEKLNIKCVNYLQHSNLGWNPLNYDTNYTSSYANLNLPKYNATTRLYNNTSITASNPDDNNWLVLMNFLPNVSILNLKKNVYRGFNPKDFIVLGRVNINNTIKIVSSNGDYFTNNYYRGFKRNVNAFRINIDPGASDPIWVYLTNIATADLLIKGNWGRVNNNSISILDNFTYEYTTVNTSNGELENYLNIDYSHETDNKESCRSLNDKVIISPASIEVNKIDISYFPFRVARSIKISNENLTTNNIRTFKANEYYEMPNNRGEVISVRGTNKQLFIQQKYSLFVAMLKDKLNTDQSSTYLGEGDIFDRTPDEIKFNTDKGFIGCTNQIATIICPEGYVVVDQIKGNIFIIGEGYANISKVTMENWFRKYWNTDDYYTLDRFGNKQPVDNPYNSIGHLIGYDEEHNRLIFTKKHYIFNFPNEVGTIYSFDGEFYYKDNIILDFNNIYYFTNNSITLSYSLNKKTWVSEHDYLGNGYDFNSYGLYSFNKDTIVTDIIEGIPVTESIVKLYKHNSKTQNRRTYYQNITYEGYIDLIFNSRLDLQKQYQAITWESVVKTINNETLYYKTIDKLMVYSDYQCSGIIDINQFNTSRNVEGIWNLNEFRDIVINSGLPIINSRGELLNNININKSYFEKSIFIGTFVVVRLIFSTITTNDTYINFINIKSRISKR